jgi:hypothetical protein
LFIMRHIRFLSEAFSRNLSGPYISATRF